jgi:hypothetical protein
MRRTTSALGLAGFVVVAAACTHAIEGAPCGCIEGYTCCVATDRCERGDAHCPEDLLCGAAFAPKCGTHSQCVDSGGIGTCTCEPGYQGADCAACAPGWAEQNGLCVEACHGPDCMTCPPGSQAENGACVTPCESLTAPACGIHGTCEVSAGQPTCVCKDGYRGSDCSECPEGQQPGKDGTCTPVCTPCGEHQLCVAHAASAICACVTGYADASNSDASLDCTWQGQGLTGGVRDPGFEDASAWDSEGAVFEPDAFGEGDQGVYFAQDTLCTEPPPHLSQVIQMPARELAEPFVLVLEGVNRAVVRGECPLWQTVLLGSTEHYVPFPIDTVQTARVCMGDEAYGPDVHLSLVPDAHNCPNEVCKTRMLSSFRIEPAQPSECPDHDLKNPNFDDASGWRLYPADNAAAASILDGRLQLHEDASSYEVYASQIAHVPLHAKAAIEVTYFNNVASDGGVILSLDGAKLLELQQTGPRWVTRRHCIPHEFWGSFRDLRVGFETTEGGITTVQVDTIRFLDSPDCAVEETGVHDPSLEELERAHWWFFTDELGAKADTADGGHGGARSFVFTGMPDAVQGRGYLGQLIRIPHASPGGLRLEFYQRGDEAAANTSQLTLTLQDALTLRYATWRTITVSSEWTKVQSDCLPHWTQGRLFGLEIYAEDRATGTTGQNSIYVDDVMLVPDSSCP